MPDAKDILADYLPATGAGANTTGAGHTSDQ